ncbi:MAG: hypothetical protein N2050_09305 [Flavobacteriales bacterium]|nr:hypothetical protein [Flavobacteriales bacterium]
MTFKFKVGQVVLWSCVLKTIALSGSSVQAQVWRVRVGYSYLRAPAWEEAQQVYYFSRPFLTGHAAYLQSGCTAAIARIFSTERAPFHGLELDYVNALSSYRDASFRTFAQVHLLSLGYRLHLKRISQPGGFYGELGLGPSIGLLQRRTRSPGDEEFQSVQKAPGMGVELKGELAWKAALGSGLWRPGLFFRTDLRWLYMPSAETVLMYTKGVLLRPYQWLFFFQGGVLLEWR